MKYFSQIPEGKAIIRSNGVYRQVDLFCRDDRVYAKYGAGYVRLLQGGGTTQPRINWLEFDAPNGTVKEGAGEVTYKPKTKPRAVA